MLALINNLPLPAPPGKEFPEVVGLDDGGRLALGPLLQPGVLQALESYQLSNKIKTTMKDDLKRSIDAQSFLFSQKIIFAAYSALKIFGTFETPQSNNRIQTNLSCRHPVTWSSFKEAVDEVLDLNTVCKNLKILSHLGCLGDIIELLAVIVKGDRADGG